MPIAGGILVAGSAARCLSSAAGMLRFLARLSGRRRHVRRSCGPGGGCCATVHSFETTARTTASTASTASTAGSSGSVAASSEVVAGTTTTSAARSVRHQNRRRDWDRDPSEAFEDPRWVEDVPNRVGSPEYERLFATSGEDRRERAQSRQVRQLRQERQERQERRERTRNSSDARMDHRVRDDDRECSRLTADCREVPTSGRRFSLDDSNDCELHRVEEIRDNERSARRRRLHGTSGCCSSTTLTESRTATATATATATTTTTTGTGTSTTGTGTGSREASRTDSRSERGTSPDYVDPIVRDHRHHVDVVDVDGQRGTTQNQRDTAGTNFSGSSSRRRSRIPPYLATLLIISYTLFGIADACSSRSTPKPRPPTPTPRPNITFHMYTCPPDYAEWYCLNGATCFTVKIQESLLYNCLCANGFIGQRCEFKDLDGSYLPSRQRVMLETASIAGGATIAVFLVVIICIAAYIHCKRKQKEMRTSGTCVDTVDGPGRDPELRPFSNRSRSLMIFMAKNPNGSMMCPSIEQTRMPGWNDYSQMESARMASVNEAKRGSSH